jgi:hypothetical protein
MIRSTIGQKLSMHRLMLCLNCEIDSYLYVAI